MSNAALIEDAVFRFASSLATDARSGFEDAAYAALAELSPDAIGPGSIDRALRRIWQDFFTPPQLDHEPRWSSEREQRNRLLEENAPTRVDRRRGRTSAMRPKPIGWRGVRYPSRGKLAEALVPMCDGRDVHAVESMLRKLNDDPEATIAHYAGKPKPRSATFAPPAP